MKALLRVILGYLERKFPDRIELTLQEFQEMREELGALNKAYQALTGQLEAQKSIVADIQKVKDEVSKLHVVLGFSRGQAPLER